MKVLVCGDREWTSPAAISKRLAKLPSDTLVIHGAARGADRMAGEAATAMGLSVMPFPADWATYGKRAGSIRNTAMLALEPDLVLAFHNDIEASKGTADTVKKAHRLGIPVEIIEAKGGR